MNSQTVLVVFVALTGVALLVQAAVMVAVVLAAKKALDKIRVDFEQLRSSAVPFFTATREVIAKVAPKVEPVTEDLVKAATNLRTVSSDLAEVTARAREISVKVRGQVEAVDASATEVLAKIRHQSDRVDSMVTNTLDAADRAAEFLHNTVSVPARQLSGILAAIKAITESLRGPSAASRTKAAPPDQENFV